MSKFQNKYRIETARLTEYDYSQAGAYFITICTQNHNHIFGEIANGIIKLNEFGKIVEKCWFEIPIHFPNVSLDVFVIMPNHIHGIVMINENEDISVETRHAVSLQKRQLGYSQAGSLSVIIGSYKSACSKLINIVRNTPGQSIWQRNYYEHVIRNEKSLSKIRDYIVNNPLNWEFDELNT
ncbi:MAG: transposase [Desulfobulbaceae bacterium]|nr:transposase [Desulfobulbaceae bacterium]